MLFAMVAVAALVVRRDYSSGASLVASAAIKSSSLFVAPFAFVEAVRPRRSRAVSTSAATLPPPPDRKHKWRLGFRSGGGRAFAAARSARGRLAAIRLIAGALAAALVIGAAGYLAFGWEWLHAFGLAGENQGRTSHMSIPVTFARLSGIDEGAVRVAALAIFGAAVAWLLVWTWRGTDWIRAAAWAATGLLLATSWLLPWYLVWPLPLAAVARDRALAFVLLALTAYQLGARIPL
jgi:hypothetical protein